MAGKSFCFLTTVGNNTWIIDNAASDHIIHNLSLLHDTELVHEACYITMPNEKKAQIQHVGSMTVDPGLVLKNVLHSPEFQFNVLYITRHTKQFLPNVTFTPDLCLLQEPTMQRAVILVKGTMGCITYIGLISF